MTNPNFILAYVDNAPKSAELYGHLLGQKPVESSPGFAMFVLPNGVKFGLWARNEVEPAANAPGGIELGFEVKDDAALHATLADWTALGLKVLQMPTRMDFGLTFTVADPDGHRLRVFAYPA